MPITATFKDNETITYGGRRDVTFCWRVVRPNGEKVTGFSMNRELAAKRAVQVATEGPYPQKVGRYRTLDIVAQVARNNLRDWGTDNAQELKDIRTNLRSERYNKSTIELVPALVPPPFKG